MIRRVAFHAESAGPRHALAKDGDMGSSLRSGPTKIRAASKPKEGPASKRSALVT